MEKKRLTKYLWYGSDVDPEGKPIVPEVSVDDDHLSGINEGEVYIHNHPDKPAIYIRTTDGKVVPIGADNLEDLEKVFLRKDKDDRSVGTISSDEGFEVGKFQEGVLGTGAAMYQNAEKATFVETDFLTVRKKAFFTNITVQELKHVGGVVILSPAAMVCSKVEELANGWKCYFNSTDSDGRKVYNEFEVGDQARSQTFNLERNTYYWRLVTSVGDDFIVLSRTDCDNGSDVPKEGDNISLLGNRSNAERQAAIILSAYGSDAPSYKQYNGINSYSLEGKQVTKLSPFGNELTGVLNIEKGSKGWNNLDGLPDSIQNAVDLANKAQETIDGTSIGAVNLLRNSGFTGDYQSEDMIAPDHLDSGSELFSRKLDKWDGDAMVYADANAMSEYSVQLGALSQSVKELIVKERYVVSFKARGSVVNVSCGDFNVKQTLTSGFAKYSFKFEFGGSKIFSIEGNARICDLQLERGTIATDWNPSPYDNDKSFAEFQSLKYLQDAIVNGNTSVIGGLILSSMLKLGNYKDGKMQKVNAGVSGIYNDENDVAFWAGGSFENAIKTVMKFKSNPMYKPTEAEWLSLANFAVSHGGDVFLRGYVYALGGFFRGAVEIAEGKIMLNEDGSGVLANKTIWWTPEGIMYRRSPDIIHWVQLSEFSSRTITYDKGTYIDISMPMSLDDVFYLSEPPVNHFSICISFRDTLNRRMVPAVLSGNFSVYDQTTHKSMRVSKLTLSTSVCVSGSEVKMTCEKDDSGSYVWTIPEAEIHVNESTGIAYIGSINKVTAEEGKIPKLESEDFQTRKIDSLSYYIDGIRGTGETISIKAEDGTHQMTFTGGLLTGYSFKEKEDET